MTSTSAEQRLEEMTINSVTRVSKAWLLWFALLVSLLGFATWAYSIQFRQGLVVTGMRDTVIWGLYISNFVFFSGVSMSGTFISAILRITGAEWRRPLTRISELTTVSALFMTGLMPVVDMGRPDRLLNLLRYGRLESPMIWDIIVIPTYLTASIIYLYLFLIPDAAFLRDRLKGKVSNLRIRFYSLVAVGWQGVPEQRHRIERAASIMMVIIIPIGVTVHSVVSWIFAMTYRAGWNSTIYAPYFATGALYSGVAMLITVMFIFRRVYHLEEYITEKHFRYLAYLMAVFGIIYFYFTFAEYLTATYKLEEGEKSLLEQLLLGKYSRLVWSGFLVGQILPVLIALLPWTRSIPILVGASVLVNIGMWIKRYIIVVPTLANPLMPYQWGIYTPTWIEVVVTVASLAGFAFTFTIFAKLFPIVSLWEMKEGREKMEQAAIAAREAATAPAVAKPRYGAGWQR